MRLKRSAHRGTTGRSAFGGTPEFVGDIARGCTLAAVAAARTAGTTANVVAKNSSPPTLVHIRREDFRVNRYQQRAETITIFAVDASGSAALHRLSEAKGAVELLLADCYVRRDRVAVIAFRGTGAEILLPPTRSLVRAKRGLASLPGGGGTPLAAGIDAARDLAVAAQRRGETPLVVVLTDGRANVGRDGKGGRAKAEAEALAAARMVKADRLGALVIDTSLGGEAQAAAIAHAMSARFLMLPQSDARQLCGVVEQASRELNRSDRHG